MNIKLTEKEKVRVDSPDEIYDIMLRILQRDNRVDQEKEHFWVVGMNLAGVILYIELVSLGSVKVTLVEPMNVYRIAILKGASRIIAVHNHPGGNTIPSANDKDMTDKLYQSGKILDVDMEDHLIISTSEFMSFKTTGLMDEIMASIKYVPPYVLVDRARNEEKNLREEMEKFYTLELEKKEIKVKQALVKSLLEKQLSIEDISDITGFTSEEITIIKENKTSQE